MASFFEWPWDRAIGQCQSIEIWTDICPLTFGEFGKTITWLNESGSYLLFIRWIPQMDPTESKLDWQPEAHSLKRESWKSRRWNLAARRRLWSRKTLEESRKLMLLMRVETNGEEVRRMTKPQDLPNAIKEVDSYSFLVLQTSLWISKLVFLMPSWTCSELKSSQSIHHPKQFKDCENADTSKRTDLLI